MSHAMTRAESEVQAGAVTATGSSTAAMCVAPETAWRAASDDALCRRLDLMRMTSGERQAALNALILGRDFGNLLIALGRVMRGLFGRGSELRRRGSSSYRARLRLRRLAYGRRRAAPSRRLQDGMR